MAISSSVIDAMLEAGATAEVIAAAWKADLLRQESELTEKRAKDAARQRKSRVSRNVTVTACDNNGQRVTKDTPLVPPSFPPAPPNLPPIIPPENIFGAVSAAPTPPKRKVGCRIERFIEQQQQLDGEVSRENCPDDLQRWASQEFGWDVNAVVDTWQDFCDYWAARAGAGGTKLDWPATWRRWCREAAERQRKNEIRNLRRG